MRIALNTRFLLDGKMEGFGWFTYEVCRRLTEMHPEHTFYLFFDRSYSEKFVFGENCIPVVLRPPARHPILFHFWFDYSVTYALKKFKIDLFFSPDGYLSKRTNVPQVGVIHDLNFEHFPQDLPKKHLNYYKKNFPKFAEIARDIITVSEFTKQDIITTYGVSPDKITVAWNGAADIFAPRGMDIDEQTRNKYTDGKPYFLFVGALHPRKNLKRLIESYQLMLQDTHTDTQLLIVGAPLWKNLPDVSATENPSIRFTGRLNSEELAEVMSAAKALTFIPYFEGFGIPMVEAMKSGTPVMAANASCLPEIAGNAALFVNPFEIDSIKAGLIQMDHDEQLRKELIAVGLERAKLFSWDNTAKTISKVLGL